MKSEMSWCYISLDSVDRETYKKEKQVDKFEDACQGTIRLAEAEGEATIGVGFLLHRNNWKQGDQMVELGMSLGADYIQLRPAVMYDQDDMSKAAEDTSWLKDCIEWLKTLEDEEFIEADLWRFQEYMNFERNYPVCYWTALNTVITPNGKIWACVNKRGHEEAEIGDLNDESFEEIWARSGTWSGDFSRCRVLCRGHLANLTLDVIMQEPVHAEFI